MPTPDYTFLMSASINGQIVVQLTDWSYKTDPIVKEGHGRIGSKMTFEADGYLEDSTPAGYAGQLGLAAAVWTQSGVVVEVKGLGGQTELLMVPIGFLDGGPHASIELLKKPDEPLQKSVKLRVTGDLAPPQTKALSYKVETSTRPDGLRVVTRTGEIKGQGAADLYAAQKAAVLAAYPRSQWVASSKCDVNLAGDQLDYTFSFVELRSPLPDAGGGNQAVSGSVTRRTERDEQMHLVTTSTYDLLTVGDPEKLRSLLRPAAPTIVLRESMEWTDYAEQRLRLSFTVLTAANGNALLDWSQTFEAVTDENPLQLESYPGTAPDYFLQPRTGHVYTQSGRAVGAGRYPLAPLPVLPNYLSKPKETYRQIDAVQYETTWSYTLVSPTIVEINSAYLKQFERPSVPEFKL